MKISEKTQNSQLSLKKNKVEELTLPNFNLLLWIKSKSIVIKTVWYW